MERLPEDFKSLESLETLRIEGNNIPLTPKEIKERIEIEIKKKSEIRKNQNNQKQKEITQNIK